MAGAPSGLRAREVLRQRLARPELHGDRPARSGARQAGDGGAARSDPRLPAAARDRRRRATSCRSGASRSRAPRWRRSASRPDRRLEPAREARAGARAADARRCRGLAAPAAAPDPAAGPAGAAGRPAARGDLGAGAGRADRAAGAAAAEHRRDRRRRPRLQRPHLRAAAASPTARVPTPNIDSIARDGVEFTHGYAGNATCAPSRAAIMTGRYPTRFGFEFTPAPKPFMRLVAALRAPRRRAAADLLRGARGATCRRWSSRACRPTRSRSPSCCASAATARSASASGTSARRRRCGPRRRASTSTSASCAGALAVPARSDDPRRRQLGAGLRSDRPLPVGEPALRRAQGRRPALPPDGLHDRLPRRRGGARDRGQPQPARSSCTSRSTRRTRRCRRCARTTTRCRRSRTTRCASTRAMIRALDRGVGRVLDALRANGLEENTLVIFTSDNGGANYIGLPDINRPYRGWKMTFFEGGVHTPFFAKWPARAAARARRSTRRSRTSTSSPPRRRPPARRCRRIAPIDGVDLRPVRARRAHGRAARRALLALGPLPRGARRRLEAPGLRAPEEDLALRPDQRSRPSARTSPTREPDKVRELSALLAAHEAQMVPPAWPSLIEGPIAIDHPLGVPRLARTTSTSTGRTSAGAASPPATRKRPPAAGGRVRSAPAPRRNRSRRCGSPSWR